MGEVLARSVGASRAKASAHVLRKVAPITAWTPATIRAFGADHFPRPPLRRVA